MTGDDNTKVCNNKTLLGTCMLVSIVCMLSVGDVFGMGSKYKRRYVEEDKIIKTLASNKKFHTMLKKNNVNIKYIKCAGICGCCYKKEIDFLKTCVKCDYNNRDLSLAGYIKKRYYYTANYTNDYINRENNNICVDEDGFYKVRFLGHRRKDFKTYFDNFVITALSNNEWKKITTLNLN